MSGHRCARGRRRLHRRAGRTENFDLAWAAEQPADGTQVWDLPKAVDPTFTINAGPQFPGPQRARLRSRAAGRALARRHAGRQGPAALGAPARILAPDPRWFALHKLRLGAQTKRDPLKRRKDAVLGKPLLNAVAEAMPHYPLDDAFTATLPPELTPFWEAWRAG